MNQTKSRILSLMLAFVLVLSLFAGVMPVQAEAKQLTSESEYVTGSVASTNYTNVIKNWGTRGETCTCLSPNAEEFYTTTTYAALSALTGGTGTSDAKNSALFTALHKLMADAHTTQTSYGDVRYLLAYTDCQEGDTSKACSFESGTIFDSTWDSGNTWAREHVWPSSKCLHPGHENTTADESTDIMMLRAALNAENSSHSNKAYGESEGYHNPPDSIKGDVARTFLYMYVRWEITDGNGNTDSDGNAYATWGQYGVIESLDVLLKWMEADPVDTWEMGRNDSVESITGTRNVFIDYPELAFTLFGQAVPDKMITPSRGLTGVNCDHANKASYAAVAATCTSHGNLAYSQCNDCHMYFDAEGTAVAAVPRNADLNLENHSSDKYTYTSTSSTQHQKKYACCGAVAATENHIHNYSITCTACGYKCDHSAGYENNKCKNCGIAAGGSTTTYTKVTSNTLTTGQYVLVCSNGYVPTYLSGSWILSQKPAEDFKEDTSDYIWTLTVTDSGVTLCDKNGKYIAPSSGNNNGIKSGEYNWGYTFSDGTFVFTGQGSDTVTLASNTGSSNKFRAYKNTTVSNYSTSYPSNFTLFKVEITPSSCTHSNVGIAATCSSKAICADCYEEFGEFDATNHPSTATQSYEADNSNHWKVYSCCKAEVADSKTAHSYTNGICTICDHVCTHEYEGNNCKHCNAEKPADKYVYLYIKDVYVTEKEYTYTSSSGSSKQELTTSSNQADAVKLVMVTNTDGTVSFKTAEGKYLYADSTDVKFVDTISSEGHTSFIVEEDGEYVKIKCSKATYNKNAQYLEYYSGCITVYGFNSSKADIYQFQLICAHSYTKNLVSDTVAVDANCLAPAKYYLKCDICGEVNKALDPVESTAHPELGNHALSSVPLAPATCTENGTKAHHHCSICKKNFKDAEGKTEISDADLVIGAAHTLETVTAQAGTCKAEGIIAHKHCSACGKNFDDAGKELSTVTAAKDPANHAEKESKWIDIGNGQHQKKYTCCGVTDGEASDHVFENMICKDCGATEHTLIKVDATEPSCTENGNIEYWHCTDPDCGKNFEDETGTKELTDVIIPKSHTLVLDLAIEVTCTTDGRTSGLHCQYCDYKVGGQFIPATGHTWGTETVTKAVTCTENGAVTKTCSVCKASVVETLIAKGHTEVIDAAKAATCTDSGLTEGKHCSVCNTVFVKQETIAALGHSWDNGRQTAAATCTTDGTKTFTCSTCQETKAEKIAAVGSHAFRDWQKTADGEESRVCSACGERETRAVEESYTAVVITIASVAVLGGAACAAYLFLFKKKIV